MVQGYYTLQEAAQFLDMTVDELKGLAQKSQIRSFQDRGTLRFRIQDIQELQRQRLGESHPELTLGEPPPPAPASGPRSGVSKSRPAGKSQEVFDFDLDESVEIGKEPLSLEGSGVRSKSGLLRSGPKSQGPKSQGPKSSVSKSGPKTPKQGSDSDVKLVADGSEFAITVDERASPGPADSDVRLGEVSVNKRASGPSSRHGRSGKPHSPADSGVRLVPMEEDAVDDLGATTESDAPLRKAPSHRPAENMLNTDEIDLDAEIRDREASGQESAKPDTIFKTNPSQIGKPGSPFELSDNDLDRPLPRTSEKDYDAAGKTSKLKSTPSRTPKPPKKNTEFDIVPGDEDFSLELGDDSIELGAEPKSDDGPKSGINLSRPSDKGISLEKKRKKDDSDFDIDDGPATPKPSRASSEDSDDSEFELSLDDVEGATEPGDATDDSEFELALDESALADDDSDFDLELTEDVAPKTPPRGKAKEKPAAKGKGKKKPADDDEDLFDTDFELPAVDEDTDETDAGSSDFELALDDSDISVEDESGSQVVALDEEEDEEGFDTGDTMDADLDDFDEYDEGDIEEEPEVQERVVVQEVIRDRWVKPAPWGVLPVVLMAPCLIVLVLAGIMGWELVQSSSGFRTSGFLTRSVGDMMNVKVK